MLNYKQRISAVFLFSMLAILMSTLACGGGQFFVSTPTLTPTVQPTSTPLPTSTPKPTLTPEPTATLRPTPAPVGEAVTYGSLEITLLKVTTHDLIVPGGLYYWYSKPGEIFIDLGVLVRNLNPGRPVSVQWQSIYIVDVNGDSWYANFGDYKRVDVNAKYDPYNIEIGKEVAGNDVLQFDKDTYLRLVYYTTYDPKKPILFGIEDSPNIIFTVKK